MIGLAWCLLASFSALVSADSQPQQYNTFHYANHPYIKYMGHHPGYAQPAAPAPAPTPAPYGEKFSIFSSDLCITELCFYSIKLTCADSTHV